MRGRLAMATTTSACLARAKEAIAAVTPQSRKAARYAYQGLDLARHRSLWGRAAAPTPIATATESALEECVANIRLVIMAWTGARSVRLGRAPPSAPNVQAGLNSTKHTLVLTDARSNATRRRIRMVCTATRRAMRGRTALSWTTDACRVVVPTTAIVATATPLQLTKTENVECFAPRATEAAPVAAHRVTRASA